jgi:soluble lytic murein transglycosylase-like protein
MTLLAGVAAVPTSTPLSPSAAAPAPDCAMAVAPRLLSSDCEAFVADAAALQASGDDIDLVLRLMDAVKSPLDAAARRRVAGEVVATGLTIPSGDRRPWYVLLAVESKFDQRARSAAGAVGVGQIVPIDLNYFERVTGVRATRQSLAKSLRVNLAVSARFYSYLASRTRSRVLALVAYNAGANSGEVRNLSNVTAINLETANYVAKHAFLMDATGEGRELLAMAP